MSYSAFQSRALEREEAVVSFLRAIHPSSSPSPDPRLLTMSIFVKIDDKHIPLYRILWVSDTPHFCGSTECEREGQYEIRLEFGETVWGTREERDTALEAIEAWRSD